MQWNGMECNGMDRTAHPLDRGRGSRPPSAGLSTARHARHGSRVAGSGGVGGVAGSGGGGGGGVGAVASSRVVAGHGVEVPGVGGMRAASDDGHTDTVRSPTVRRTRALRLSRVAPRALHPARRRAPVFSRGALASSPARPPLGSPAPLRRRRAVGRVVRVVAVARVRREPQGDLRAAAHPRLRAADRRDDGRRGRLRGGVNAAGERRPARARREAGPLRRAARRDTDGPADGRAARRARALRGVVRAEGHHHSRRPPPHNPPPLRGGYLAGWLLAASGARARCRGEIGVST